MEYVRLHTSIPIPTILSIHIEGNSSDGDQGWILDGDQNWIIMERLPGDQLGSVWPEMKDEAQAETIRQLKHYLEQLR